MGHNYCYKLKLLTKALPFYTPSKLRDDHLSLVIQAEQTFNTFCHRSAQERNSKHFKFMSVNLRDAHPRGCMRQMEPIKPMNKHWRYLGENLESSKHDIMWNRIQTLLISWTKHKNSNKCWTYCSCLLCYGTQPQKACLPPFSTEAKWESLWITAFSNHLGLSQISAFVVHTSHDSITHLCNVKETRRINYMRWATKRWKWYVYYFVPKCAFNS